MTTTSTSRPESLRHRQGLTEQAAQAAIDQACRRLRLPTIRAVVDDAVTAAPPCVASRAPASPARNGSPTSTSPRTPTSTPPPSTSSPPATGSAAATRCA